MGNAHWGRESLGGGRKSQANICCAAPAGLSRRHNAPRSCPSSHRERGPAPRSKGSLTGATKGRQRGRSLCPPAAASPGGQGTPRAGVKGCRCPALLPAPFRQLTSKRAPTKAPGALQQGPGGASLACPALSRGRSRSPPGAERPLRPQRPAHKAAAAGGGRRSRGPAHTAPLCRSLKGHCHTEGSLSPRIPPGEWMRQDICRDPLPFACK